MGRLRGSGSACALRLAASGVLASLVLAGGACGGGGDEVDPGGGTETTTSAGRGPTLLMFHSGAFVFGAPGELDRAAGVAEGLGFDPVPVRYPLSDLPAAVERARSVAERYGRGGREVFAYGESAGGSLAALLAERDQVSAAVTYSQITRLRTFIRNAPDPDFYELSINATPTQIAAASPDRGRSRVPLLAMVAELDYPYLTPDTRRWDRRNPEVRVIEVPGHHIGTDDPTELYEGNVERGLGWLARRAGIE